MLCGVVGGIRNDCVCERRFPENPYAHAGGGFEDGYVQVVKFIVEFCFFCEL